MAVGVGLSSERRKENLELRKGGSRRGPRLKGGGVEEGGGWGG